jgi:membrane-associated phospholipid phosphatase
VRSIADLPMDMIELLAGFFVVQPSNREKIMASAEPPHVPVIPPPRFFFGVSLAALLFYTVWSWLVRNDSLQPFDDLCAQHWQDWSESNVRTTTFMVFLTDLGGIASMTLLACMISIWQTAIKHRTLALGVFAVVVGGALVNQGFKEGFGRTRPPNPAPVVHEKNASYPSGHSMGCTIGFGLLGYALILPQRRRPRRVIAINFMLVIILAIGFSRMYLRAHWFSDVVGGWSLGIAWLFLCLGWLELRRHRFATHHHSSVANP